MLVNKLLQLEERLHGLEHKVRELMRHQKGILVAFREIDGRFIYTVCEGELLTRVGLTAEQVIGRDPHEVLPLHIADHFVAHYRLAWQGETITFEGSFPGDIHFMGLLIPTWQAGQVVEVIGFGFDTTERVRADRKLAEQEKLFRLIAESATDMVALFQTNGICLYASPSCRSLLGLDPAEMMGMPIQELCHPDDLPRMVRLSLKGLRGRAGKGTYRLRRKDGTYVWVETVLSPIADEQGCITQFRTSSRDITERRLREEQAARQQLIELTLTRIYAGFLEASTLDDAIDSSLAEIGRAVGANRTYLFQFRGGGEMMDNTHKWRAPGIHSERENIRDVPTASYPWWMSKLRRGEHIDITDLDSMPDEAAAERALLSARGTVSLVVYPVHAGSELVGFIGLDNVAGVRSWSAEHLGLIRVVSEIFGGAIARERSEEALRRSEERFRSLVQNAMDVILVMGADGTILYESPSVFRVLGYTPDEWLGRNMLDRLPPAERLEDEVRLMDLLGRPGAEFSGEVRFLHKNGTVKYMQVIGRNLVEDPNVSGIVANYRDITERRRFEAQLLHQAFHDPLTNLPNRTMFLNRLGDALAAAAETARQVAVLYLDLDGFKVVNDSLGHPVGDELLVVVSRRLQGGLDASATIARMGGDEFVVLLERVQGEADAVEAAHRLASCFQAPVSLCGRDLFITASIGIVISSPEHTPETMIRDADAALYGAKARGRSRYELFTPTLTAQALERLEVESDLRKALLGGEFMLHYQPIVCMDTLQVTALEALVRWRHPTRGLISPDRFIPLAEEIGLIHPIGAWILREACTMANTGPLRDAGVVVSVNLSARQFRQPDLAGMVRRVLQETDLPPQRLQLEITETAMMQDFESARRTVASLRDLGVKLALDDMGTGYSSLQYLRHFCVDALKIDRSFVQHLPANREDRAIVHAIVGLSRALDMSVVAEGVETREQVAILQSAGCSHWQGYLFSRPVPAEEVGALLQAPGGREMPKR